MAGVQRDRRMSTLAPETARAAEHRLRTAYARRAWDDPRYAWQTPGYLFLMHDLARRLLAVLTQHSLRPLSRTTILDVGCGTGYWLRQFVEWGAQPARCTGVDLLPDRLRAAHARCPQGMTLHCASAAALPFAAEMFDVVCQFTVLTSVLEPPMRQQIATEMLRVLKRDGIILWYDFRVKPPRNPDVCGIRRREIARLFPACRVRLTPITVAPPLLRALAPSSWLACLLLSQLPWCCTHYLGVIRKRPC